MSKEYNIGIYIRLSMADEDTGYGSKAESDSIGNQRINNAEVNQVISSEQAWYLRERYLRMELE